MLTPRNAIIAASVLCVVLVVASVLGSLATPDSDGAAADSYGLGREGNRGLVELLTDLGLPVERRIGPPSGPPPADATLLLIAPDVKLVRVEPQPLRQAMEWVRRGGRIVVAPDFADAREQKELERLSEELEHFDADILPALGLDDVDVELLISADVPTDAPEDDDELVISEVAESSSGPAADRLHELVTLGAALPEVTWPKSRESAWETRIYDANGDERVLAAAFPLGAGEIVVVSDATLLSNVTLRRGDNAEWLLHVLFDGGRERVVIDEFYHGLSIRGNAWWLLTKPAFASLAVCGLLLLGLWTWRSGVLLGPPLADETESRRAIGEYIGAMSQFFLRSRDADRFVLEQLRDGVWRRLAQETGLPPASRDVERLTERLARKDPQRAARVQQAFAACDAGLQSHDRNAAPLRLAALRRLSEAA